MKTLACTAFLVTVLAVSPVAAQSVAAYANAGRIAGTISVTTKGKAKRDASGIVVYVVGFKQDPGRSIPKMTQKNRQFEPRVLAITAGQKIEFPNLDDYFHNVFSLSKTRRFDLGQFKKGKSKIKTFPRKGIVEVYCNIHPKMSATILVLPNRAYAITDKAGKFNISNIPPGEWKVFAYSRHAVRPVRAKVKITKGQTTPLKLALNETKFEFKHKNKFGEEYRDKNKKY